MINFFIGVVVGAIIAIVALGLWAAHAMGEEIPRIRDTDEIAK